MICPGIVTNVTNFGAFVDIGVHQDGLVHISELSHQFVSDPRQVVQPGEIVQVKVIDVDVDKKQIALTMLLEPAPERRVRAQQAPEYAQGSNRDGRPANRPQRQLDNKSENRGRSENANGERQSRGPRNPQARGPQRDGQNRNEQRRDDRRPQQGGSKPSGQQQPRRPTGSPFNNPFAALTGIAPKK